MGQSQSTGGASDTTVDVKWFNANFGIPTDNYRNVNITARAPYRVQGKCVCQNPDGTVNKEAFIYKAKCYKCTSKRDTFYGRGIGTMNTWGAQQNNKELRTDTTMGPTEYHSINDAKQTCETVEDCKGIVRKLDSATGEAVYVLRAGSTLFDAQGKTSWVLSRGAAALIQSGDYEGKEPATSSIPRAFADDYYFSTSFEPKSSLQPFGPTTIHGSNTTTTPNTGGVAGWITDISKYLMNGVVMSSAEDTIIQSLEQPNTYYRLNGLERRLLGNKSGTAPFSLTPAGETGDSGICVGPCDPQHPIHEPIQMIYDSFYNDKSATNTGIYALYGTTCRDSTSVEISKPAIPAIYHPQVGNKCPPDDIKNPVPIYSEVTSSGSGGSSYCRGECPYGTIDNGISCTTSQIKREAILPRYNCPPGLQKVDTVCISPCEPGFIRDAEYCVPDQNANTVPVPSSIKCSSQPYITSSVGGGSSLPSKKWLCDTQQDLDALLAGPNPVTSGQTPTSFYTGSSDIVCVADDPTTGMYYCQTIQEAMSSTADTTRDDMSKTCSTLLKAYYDLSNNLSILTSANATAQNTGAQLNNIKNTLQGVINTMCPSTAGSTPLCNTLNSQMNALRQQLNSGGSVTASIQTPMQLALQSRSALLAQMRTLQCDKIEGADAIPVA